MSDMEGSKSKTICTQGMPLIGHYVVQSTFNIQTFFDVSIVFVVLFLSFCICFTFGSAGSSFLSVSSGVSRIVNLFFLFVPQLNINPNLEYVNFPLSLEILQLTDSSGQEAVGRSVRVFVVVRVLTNTGSSLLLIWVNGPLSS